MQQNMFNPYNQPNYNICPPNPNAVNINIIAPQAYANAPQGVAQPPQVVPMPVYYPIYSGQAGYNYPSNYNNLLNMNAPGVNNNYMTMRNDSMPMLNAPPIRTQTSKLKEEKDVVPLTNEYIQSLENYLNDTNPKIRMSATNEIMKRFKEDDSRKDNPSLNALLNKSLRDTSPANRFLALTTLQLGYAAGNNETIQILKELQTKGKEEVGEDSVLASEVLLKLAGRQ